MNKFDNPFHNPKWKDVIKEFNKYNDTIPMFSGRPERVITINNDDILNLRIALNTTNTVEEFLRLI